MIISMVSVEDLKNALERVKKYTSDISYAEDICKISLMICKEYDYEYEDMLDIIDDIFRYETIKIFKNISDIDNDYFDVKIINSYYVIFT